jgi:DNA polymerase-3 subunit epsilon
VPVKQNPEKPDAHLRMDHKILLQTLLREIQDGVIVCDPDANIVQFNQTAADLFSGIKSISNGDSLYTLCLKSPVDHARNLLQYQQQEQETGSEKHPSTQFMNATPDQQKFFRCRLSLLPSHTVNNNFFMIIFEDVSAWYRPDNLLHTKIDEFRGPMTNLRAALENLTEHPEMSPVMRSAFENVLVQESLNLTGAFDSLDQACNLLMQTQSHLTEMNSDILFGFVAKHLHSKSLYFSASDDQTAIVKIDSYGFLLILDHLAHKIQQDRSLTELSCEAHIGEQFVYFDFIWSGEFLPTATVEAMLEEKLQNSVGELTVADSLHSMGGDIWSQQHENSRSTLRLALPLAMRMEK